jgi:hypothetical protein
MRWDLTLPVVQLPGSICKTAGSRSSHLCHPDAPLDRSPPRCAYSQSPPLWHARPTVTQTVGYVPCFPRSWSSPSVTTPVAHPSSYIRRTKSFMPGRRVSSSGSAAVYLRDQQVPARLQSLPSHRRLTATPPSPSNSGESTSPCTDSCPSHALGVHDQPPPLHRFAPSFPPTPCGTDYSREQS